MCMKEVELRRWDVFTLPVKQPHLCQKLKIRSPLGNSLQVLLWKPSALSVSIGSPGKSRPLKVLASFLGEFHTQASQDLACPSWREDFVDLAFACAYPLGQKLSRDVTELSNYANKYQILSFFLMHSLFLFKKFIIIEYKQYLNLFRSANYHITWDTLQMKSRYRMG